MIDDVAHEKIEEWEREIALVRLTGACPYCDGSVESQEMVNGKGDEVLAIDCTDCSEKWWTLVAELPDY